MMRRAARLHDNVGYRLFAEEPLESRSTQSVPPYDMPTLVCDRNFKYVLCEVHSNRRSIHLVSSWFELMGVSSTRLMMPQNREESIPS